eukprot:Hpha_TRINITY_DN16894_c1_g3::TRINITY_DN16894_c1_g3_i1::g.152129::m.152129
MREDDVVSVWEDFGETTEERRDWFRVALFGGSVQYQQAKCLLVEWAPEWLMSMREGSERWREDLLREDAEARGRASKISRVSSVPRREKQKKICSVCTNVLPDGWDPDQSEASEAEEEPETVSEPAATPATQASSLRQPKVQSINAHPAAGETRVVTARDSRTGS